MKWKLLLFLPLGLFAAFAGTLALGLSNDPSRIPSVLIDKPVPALTLAPLGSSLKLFERSDLAGHVSLINVFGSWCAVCVEEHPTLMRLARTKAIAVYGIDWKDTPREGQRWLAEQGNPYIAVGNDEAGKAALDLGVSGAPETFVVDAKGRVRYKHIGAIDTHTWQAVIAPIVKKLEAER